MHKLRRAGVENKTEQAMYQLEDGRTARLVELRDLVVDSDSEQVQDGGTEQDDVRRIIHHT